MPRLPQQSSPEKLVDSGEFMELVKAWDPEQRPVHCSNCRHAIVTGDGVHVPAVHCELGHGPDRSFWQLTRAYKPIGFWVAANCPDFAGMDD